MRRNTSKFSTARQLRPASGLVERSDGWQLTALGVVSALVVSSAVSLVGPVPALAAAAPSTAPLASQTASQQAASTGQSVEVTDETTETSQVMANPDGTFTLSASRVPVRVKQNGSWTPIDTTLHANPDGTLAPAATTEPVTFSGGGAGPMVTVAAGTAGSVSFSWPTPLPTPSVSGNTATYPAVLPGVDLKLTADADSYNEVLVVHDATAASNPALAQIHLAATVTGVSLASDALGGLSVSDSSGVQVLHGSAPVMWDSHLDSELGPAPAPTDAGSGTISKLAMTLNTANSTGSAAVTSITLVPPSASLTGPGVVYPLYIDPSLTAAKQHYAVVFNNGWHYYDDASNDMKVGACPQADDATCDNIGTGRSYFSLNTSALNGRGTYAHIYSADIYVYQIHGSSGCTSEPVNLWSAGGFNGSTVWGGPATVNLETESSGAGDQCSTTQAQYIDFNGTKVVAQIQAAANTNTDSGSFGLIAPDETNQRQWKRFEPYDIDSQHHTAPHATIVYAYPPSTPTNLTLSQSVACSGKPVYTRDTTPTFSAQAVDNNPSPNKVGLWFQTQDTSGGNIHKNTTGIPAASNTPASWTLNTAGDSGSALPNGAYGFRVYATSTSPDSSDPAGATSAWYYYTVRSLVPTTPGIASFDYPQNSWGSPVSTPGQFVLHGDSTTAGFTYTFDSSGTEALPTDIDCGYANATKQWAAASSGGAVINAPATSSTTTALTAGRHTLYVRSFDDAHNISSEYSYNFYVSPNVTGEGNIKHEAEDQDPATTTGTALAQGQNDCVYKEGTSSLWSGGYEEHLAATKTGDNFTFSFAAAVAGDYALGINVTTQYHFGKLHFTIDKNTSGSPRIEVTTVGQAPDYAFDASIVPASTQFIPLGADYFTVNSTHTITVTLEGTNGTNYSGTCPNGGASYSDNGYTAGIDYITAIPINNTAPTSFQSALNNNGITDDINTPKTAANIQAATASSPATLGLSASALRAANLGSGQTKTIDGIPFTMPTYTAGKGDNLMADGQTISLGDGHGNYPAANNVDLLVASTCGAITSAQNIQLTFNYGSAFFSTPLPSVPAWDNTSAGTLDAGVTRVGIFNRDIGTTTDTTKAYLYHLHIQSPISSQPPSNITSITLPNLQDTFYDGCANNTTLHILALSTS